MSKRSGTIAISIETPLDLLRQVDAWAAGQRPAATRAEAFRRLLQIGLTSAGAAADEPRSTESTEQAEGMAGTVIDSLGDQSATPTDRAHRKTRLLKGPEEFRAMRGNGHDAKRRR